MGFPSPIGELHFSIVLVIDNRPRICFRPLSGSYISQFYSTYSIGFAIMTVSVPYRGATFLNIFTLRYCLFP